MPTATDAQRRRGTVEAWLASGHAAQLAGRYDEAASWYRRALERDPANFDALQLLGATRLATGHLDDGIALLQRALALNGSEAGVHNNLGNALLQLGRRDEAVRALRAAATLEPQNATICLNLGNAQREAGDLQGSLRTLLQLLQRNPGLAAAHFSLGLTLRAAVRPREALVAFERTLKLESRHAHAHLQRGLAYADLADPVAAHASLSTAATCAPAGARRWMTLLAAYSGLELAEWTDWSAACEMVPPSATATGETEAIDPMRAMLFPLDDAGLAAITARFATVSVVPAMTHRPRPVPSKAADGRIRLAYLSPDFGDHPVCRLLAPALRAHDRSRFCVAAYAWGAGAGTPHRALIESAVERCIDVGTLSDTQFADLLRRDRIDIAIDLAGYTGNSRPRVFLEAPAPVQVGWLGYPGTLGTGALDYLIADIASVPAAAEANFVEKIVRLGHGFMPYDTSADVASPRSRAEFGLDADAVVFACFAQTRKLNPLLFDVWMQVLREVPAAQLWLGASNPSTGENLRAEAIRRGVDPRRLVIAPRAPNQAEYLARYALADMTLDTYPYGSHSTALDVLWAGCPLLALSGPAMPSRVSSSILSAAGLADLIQPNLVAYRDAMLSLAQDRPALARLRDRTRQARQSALFDTPRLVRDLETAFERMHARAGAGLPPASFDIP